MEYLFNCVLDGHNYIVCFVGCIQTVEDIVKHHILVDKSFSVLFLVQTWIYKYQYAAWMVIGDYKDRTTCS